MLTGEADAGGDRAIDIDPRGPELSEYVALARRDHRDRSGRYVVEGARFVYAALRERAAVDGVLVAPDLLDAAGRDAASALRRRGAPIRGASRAEFKSVSAAGEPSGVAVIVRQRWTAPRRPTGRDAPVWLAVGHVRSAGNLGTMLRTALAAGAAGALFLDPETDPYDPASVRASMGAVLALPLARMTAAHLDAWKRRTGSLVVGSSARASRDFRDVPRRRPTVVMLGCERGGMSRAQRRVCDITVSIPMAPGSDSLNVGVAAGILLFAVRHP